MRLIKQVFTNKDGSYGELFLVSSDRELSFDEITAISQKRWKVDFQNLFKTMPVKKQEKYNLNVQLQDLGINNLSYLLLANPHWSSPQKVVHLLVFCLD